ncbi:MAG: hypothetical protein U5L96_10500 [Owenweeksia sp.]|nr:hypothetical protein [Owenweeksia sp.]
MKASIRCCDIDIEFFYKELDTTTGQLTQHRFSIDYESQVGPFPPTSSVFSARGGPGQLYEAIASEVAINNNVLRFYDKMTFTIWSGGEKLREYIQLNKPSLGLNQTKPEFMQIENGTGLFSSRNRIRLRDIELSNTQERNYYLNPVLCDRNLPLPQEVTPVIVNFFAEEPEQQCF